MVETGDLAVTYVRGVGGLDPITVFWQDFEPGRGRVTVECYGAAWSVYFGAMSGRTIRQFFHEADVDYLTNKLLDRQFQKCNKGHEAYLRRIVNAIKSALKSAETN